MYMVLHVRAGSSHSQRVLLVSLHSFHWTAELWTHSGIPIRAHLCLNSQERSTPVQVAGITSAFAWEAQTAHQPELVSLPLARLRQTIPLLPQLKSWPDLVPRRVCTLAWLCILHQLCIGTVVITLFSIGDYATWSMVKQSYSTSNAPQLTFQLFQLLSAQLKKQE